MKKKGLSQESRFQVLSHFYDTYLKISGHKQKNEKTLLKQRINNFHQRKNQWNFQETRKAWMWYYETEILLNYGCINLLMKRMEKLIKQIWSNIWLVHLVDSQNSCVLVKRGWININLSIFCQNFTHFFKAEFLYWYFRNIFNFYYWKVSLGIDLVFVVQERFFSEFHAPVRFKYIFLISWYAFI